MRYCYRCLQPNSRPGIQFDSNGVGQEQEKALLLRVEKPDAPQGRREVFPYTRQSQIPNLIAAKPSCFARQTRLLPRKPQIVFGAGDNKRSRSGDPLKPQKVDVTPVNDVNGSAFENQHVHPLHILHVGWVNKNTHRHRAPQIELIVNFDPALGGAKSRLRKQGQRQVDHALVQCGKRTFQLQPNLLARIEFSCSWNQPHCQSLPNPAIPSFVGIGESGLRHRLSKSQVIKLFEFGIEAFEGVAKPIALAKYRKKMMDINCFRATECRTRDSASNCTARRERVS